MFGNLVELSYANDLVPLSAVDMLRFSLIYRYTSSWRNVLSTDTYHMVLLNALRWLILLPGVALFNFEKLLFRFRYKLE